MAATDADALRAELEAARRELQAEDARTNELDAEIEEAAERQRLRKEIACVRDELRVAQQHNRNRAELRADVDADRAFLDGDIPRAGKTEKGNKFIQNSSGQGITQCNEQVAQGEYVWTIKGMRWLQDALWAVGKNFAESPEFMVGHGNFSLRYNPEAGCLFEWHCGSLAIFYHDEADLSLQYRIYIKARDGSFVQWGEGGHGRYDSEVSYVWREDCFGPDVHWENHRPASLTALGIFGLSHEELLRSEWVQDDELTVKCVLEVRPRDSPKVQDQLGPSAELPAPTVVHDMHALFEKSTNSDVRFVVGEEVIHAHSPILCERSAVFERQLNAGMQESISKVIVIKDCSAQIFRAFLKFLYTDILPSLEELAAQTPCSAADPQDESSQLKALLAVSHKYQAERLRCWCEAQLCKRLSTSAVCGILCQAHLLQAQHLEQQCLSYIKNHMTEVMQLPTYMEIVKTWPEIVLKINLFLTGATETQTATVLRAHKRSRTAGAEDESNM